MAKPRRRHPEPFPIAAQARQLRESYPQGRVIEQRRELIWIGEIQPAAHSSTYLVLVHHKLKRGARPLVYVVRPPLRRRNGERIPHVFEHNTLCLHLDHEFHAGMLLSEILLPWISEWLYFYEAWQNTGEWLGGGQHPTTVRTRADRRAGSSGESSFERLKRVLTTAFPDESLDELLATANAPVREPREFTSAEHGMNPAGR